MHWEGWRKHPFPEVSVLPLCLCGSVVNTHVHHGSNRRVLAPSTRKAAWPRDFFMCDR